MRLGVSVLPTPEARRCVSDVQERGLGQPLVDGPGELGVRALSHPVATLGQPRQEELQVSMNLHIEGGLPVGLSLYQTPTEVSYRIIEGASKVGCGGVEHDVAALSIYYRAWVHELYDPPELTGKDSRNAYLQQKRLDKITALDSYVDSLVEHVRTAPRDGNHPLVTVW